MPGSIGPVSVRLLPSSWMWINFIALTAVTQSKPTGDLFGPLYNTSTNVPGDVNNCTGNAFSGVFYKTNYVFNIIYLRHHNCTNKRQIFFNTFFGLYLQLFCEFFYCVF